MKKQISVRVIPITQGLLCLIDEKDYALVSKHKWHLSRCNGKLYAATKILRKETRLHKVIMGGNPSQHIDHKNGDGLDNRRDNLRFASRSQNLANSKLQSNNKSGYRGVCWAAKDKRWRATISVDGKGIYLGNFLTREEAAKTYDNAASKYFGNFAKLNFN